MRDFVVMRNKTFQYAQYMSAMLVSSESHRNLTFLNVIKTRSSIITKITMSYYAITFGYQQITAIINGA